MLNTRSIQYDIRLLNRQPYKPVRKYDYGFFACGSDYRAYQILRNSEDFGLLFNETLMFDFLERQQSTNKKVIKAYQSYKNLHGNISQIPCSISDPSSCVKVIHDAAPCLKDATSVAVDISCFTKPYFFWILKFLYSQITLEQITVLYTEPMSYVFSGGLYLSSYHSTYGPLSVMEIPGFPGNDTRTSKKTLIILLGFDGELSKFIMDEIAPEDTIVVNGFPAYSPKFKEISLINNEKLISSIPHESIRYSRANSPFETFNLLEDLLEEQHSAFLNIAPLGTKPMALGACLFALFHPSVRIVYPLPEKYADITTQECWNSWLYEVPLGMTNP
jgi:hypothetical protein